MIWLFLLLALGVLGGWLLAHATETPLEDARAEPRGQFIQLTDGKTHYAWHGSDTGPVMVCIHGLSTPSYVWGALIPHLVVQGYRVLTYDLYGRGLSDRVEGPQTREFFLRQLRQLLAALEITDRVTLCGYSMGGRIAAARAVEAPDTVSRIILIASAGLGHDLGRFAQISTRLPFIGDWLHAVAGPLLYQWQTMGLARTGARGQEIADRLQADFRIEGTMAAILSSQRNLLEEDMRQDHELIAKSGLPVLAIWGEGDDVIPPSSMGALAQANRDAVQVALPGGHGLPWTHPREISKAIAEGL